MKIVTYIRIDKLLTYSGNPIKRRALKPAVNRTRDLPVHSIAHKTFSKLIFQDLPRVVTESEKSVEASMYINNRL